MLSADPSGLIRLLSPIDQPAAPVSSFDAVSSTFTRVSSSPAQTNTQYCVFASRCTELALNGAGRRPYFLTVYLFTPATGPSKVAPFFVRVAIWSLSLGRSSSVVPIQVHVHRLVLAAPPLSEVEGDRFELVPAGVRTRRERLSEVDVTQHVVPPILGSLRLVTRTCAAAGPAPPINATITAMVVISLAVPSARWVAVDLSFPIHPRLRFAVCPSRLVPRSSVFPALMLFLSRASGCFHVWRPWHRRSRAPPLPAQRGPRERAVIPCRPAGGVPGAGRRGPRGCDACGWGHEVSRFAPPPRRKSHRDVTPVARSARPAAAPDRPEQS